MYPHCDIKRQLLCLKFYCFIRVTFNHNKTYFSYGINSNGARIVIKRQIFDHILRYLIFSQFQIVQIGKDCIYIRIRMRNSFYFTYKFSHYILWIISNLREIFSIPAMYPDQTRRYILYVKPLLGLRRNR